MTGGRDRDSDARESLTQQEIVVAGLVGRYVERRERGEAPCADDLSAVAAEFGPHAVEQLRRLGHRCIHPVEGVDVRVQREVRSVGHLRQQVAQCLHVRAARREAHSK